MCWWKCYTVFSGSVTCVIWHGNLYIPGAACRLYFDLEFKSEFNPGKDGTKMVEMFIKVTINLLLRTQGGEMGVLSM